MPVVNIRSNVPYDVYIGRPRHGAHAPWGNPFPITASAPRAAVIAELESFLLESTAPAAVFMRAHLHELRDKTLGCFCKPAACHGDVYLHHAAHLQPGETLPLGGKPGVSRLTPHPATLRAQPALGQDDLFAPRAPRPG